MEIRKDYILDRYVIVSEGRGKRPFEFSKGSEIKEAKTCFFCPGNEDLTPPEIGRIGTKKQWKVRWFPNKFAAVGLKGSPVFKKQARFFTSSSAYGVHEVIAETPDHKKQMEDLSIPQIKNVFRAFIDMIDNLSKIKGIKYVCIFKNHGKQAGTSLIHSHSQVIAYNRIPKLVKEKLKATKRYPGCPYCSIIKKEKSSKRACFENESFISFTPYASRYHYEIWLFPKKHIRNITDMDNKHLADLARMLKKILQKLKTIDAAYNMELFYSPKKENLHFHIEITPKLAILGGFEALSEDTINSISPEKAAEFYRK